MKNIKLLILWGFMMFNDVEASIVLIADPKVLAIPIVENHEPMIDLSLHKEISYGPSPEIPNNTDYTKMRQSVYEKLKEAQALLPKGLHFCLYEGYRSLELQKTLFNNRYDKVKKLHPNWSSQQLFDETTKLVSPIINADGSRNIPPHSTGGAVDVYLLDDKGQPVEMGIHPKDWMLDTDGVVSLTESEHISEEAKRNRAIMSTVLSKVGFANYPTEYWHWSYGDRYWAYSKHQAHALYATFGK